MSFNIKLFILFLSIFYSEQFSVRSWHDKETTTVAPGFTELVTPSILKKCDECPKEIRCVPQIQCPAHVKLAAFEKPQICDLPGGKFGFCCLTGQNHTYKSKKERFAFHEGIHFTIIEEGRKKFSDMINHHSSSVNVPRERPDFIHNMVFHSTPQENLHNFHMSNSAVEEVITTQVFQEKEQIPIEEFETNNVDVKFESSPLGHHCQKPHECKKNSPYRTFDGSCNNPLPHRSHWGAAGQPMERLLTPMYEDGIWLPRLHSSIDRSPLTSPREISRLLFTDLNKPHHKYNLLVMQFGQFVAHDITQSSSIKLEGDKPIECCSEGGRSVLPVNSRHFACLPIEINPHDEFYKDFNQGCMNFVRLALAPNPECKMGYGKQLSKVTHYLDGSPIYGSSLATAKGLRSFRKGKLKMFNDFGRDLLPLATEKDACADESGKTCFKSGDGRTNQIISLVVIHILFAREHNKICDILSQLNHHWTDEKLYQEARRIVIAELQHIVYNEYVPIIIGKEQTSRFGLHVRKQGWADDYSPEVNPAVTNEFTGAAFRFGHSTVDGKFHVHKDNNVDEVIDIPDVMFNPTRLRKRSFLDNMARTMMEQPMQKADSSLTHGLTRFLFRGHNPFGLDLAALNIQRGRDEALRPYNDYLEVSGHQKITNFHQLHSSRNLAEVYKHPDDIDLWVGGLLEPAYEDGVVGPTFSDIIADQFSRTRHGDRYFYENGPHINPGAFSESQLNEIRKISFSRIICDNLDHLTSNHIPPHAFELYNPRNGPVDCSSSQIPSVNFEVWRERQH